MKILKGDEKFKRGSMIRILCESIAIHIIYLLSITNNNVMCIYYSSMVF